MAETDATGVRLDSKHSHLILVDDGTKEFGHEIEFRGLFEAHVRQARWAGDEAFIIKTMRELDIGWEGSTKATHPPLLPPRSGCRVAEGHRILSIPACIG